MLEQQVPLPVLHADAAGCGDTGCSAGSACECDGGWSVTKSDWHEHADCARGWLVSYLSQHARILYGRLHTAKNTKNPLHPSRLPSCTHDP